MVEEYGDYTGLKVFSATKARDRDDLGNKVTKWLRDHKRITITGTCIRQSSDSEFHCLSIILFYK